MDNQTGDEKGNKDDDSPVQDDEDKATVETDKNKL